MDEDDSLQAWAHQQELECREQDEGEEDEQE